MSEQLYRPFAPTDKLSCACYVCEPAYIHARACTTNCFIHVLAKYCTTVYQRTHLFFPNKKIKFRGYLIFLLFVTYERLKRTTVSSLKCT